MGSVASKLRRGGGEEEAEAEADAKNIIAEVSSQLEKLRIEEEEEEDNLPFQEEPPSTPTPAEADDDEASKTTRRSPMDVAMSNHLIFANILKHCNFEDLGQIRLVSKQCFAESLPHYLTKAQVIYLHLDPNYEPDVWDLEEYIQLSVNAFLQLVHNEFESYGPYDYAGLRQYKRFHVGGDASNPVQHHYLQQFLRICGHCVTQLSLDVKVPDISTYRALMLSRLTPNLVSLDAHISCPQGPLRNEVYEQEESHHEKLMSLYISSGCSGLYDNDDDDRDGVNLLALPMTGWMQLLGRYPNLKTLHLHGFGGDGVDVRNGVGKILEAIGKIRQSDKELVNLRFLAILDGITDQLSLPSLFRNAGLSLETLELRVSSRDTSSPPYVIYEVLSSQATTLKTLIIHRHLEATISPDEPPTLPFVTSLELHGLSFQNLSPLKNFPSLQSLYLELNSNDHDEELANMLRDTPEGSAMPATLTKLHCYHRSSPTGLLGPDNVGMLARLFPNLKNLGLWLSNESLGAVLQSWPNLQYLTIWGIGVDDDGIAGIAPDFPNMPDLKYLGMRTYHGKYKYCQGPTAITEQSLIKFLELPNLERLEITLPLELDVNSELLRTLKDKIKTFKLTRAIPD